MRIVVRAPGLLKPLSPRLNRFVEPSARATALKDGLEAMTGRFSNNFLVKALHLMV
ncbi:MAG: hypothetical protein QXD61_06430 [Candidatus Caldarchaeum sp.]